MADFDLSMAITADGDEAASELKRVESGLDSMTAAEFKAAGGAAGLAKSSKDLASQQKATADAINAVTRATNPAVGSQRALEAAIRKAERAYLDGKISATAFARAQEIASRATFASATTMRQTQQGARQLGLQFNDLGTQIAAGISPMTAFIQQAGQVGYAMSQMGGTAGKVGSFLAGGWGALILIGASFLGNLIGKLLGAEEAHKKFGEAMDVSKLSAEDLHDAIEQNNEALGKSIRTTQEAEQAALNYAERLAQQSRKTREDTVAKLENARATLAQADAERARAFGGGKGAFEAAAGEQASAVAQVRALEQQLAKANADLARAQQGVALAQVPLARRRAQEGTDPSAKIRGDFDRAVAAATKEFLEHGRDLNKLNRALDTAEKAQDEANKRLQDSNRKGRTVSLGDQVSGTIGANILAAAQQHIGQTERNPSLQTFLRGQNIDPEKEAWCAAFINAVLSSQGIRGTGSNAAKSFLNFGTATNTPQKGDIVILRSGQSPSGTHVGLFAGQQGGRVQVTGGNQGGGRVTTSSFAQSSVLGFRRPPSAADQFKDEQQAIAKATKDAEQLAEFGARAAEQLGNLAARAVPQTAAQQAKQQIAEIDRIMADVEKRKPPNLDQLRKDAEAAKVSIQNGIVQPFDDFLQAQQQALNVERLRTLGLSAEAETLQEVYRMQERMGEELLPEQVRLIYDAVRARQAESKAAREAQDQQRKYLQELGQYKDVFRSLFSGNSKDVTSFPKRIFDVLKQSAGDKLFNSIFGGIFKQLEGDATGANKVKASNVKLAASADKATKSILAMAQAAGQAAGTIPGGEGGDAPEEIAQGITDSPLGGILTKIGKGIGLSDATIQSLGGIISKGAAGAATGAVVNGFLQPLGKMLGFKTSSTGAAIGGAIGSFLPIPGGDIIGSIVGSIIGGLFKKKDVPKGGVTITDAFGEPVQGGDRALSGQFVGVGQNIQDSLVNIAEQLGGALGAFKVAIGTFDGDIRVNVNGLTAGKSLNRKTPGTFDFNDDMEAAVRFAIMDAIKDGAITGLSEAVQKAIHSSSDLDRALREALKVSDLETLLKGVGGIYDKAFTNFENTAKDRLRIAKTYGLDLVKTEELNAKERVKIFDQVLQSRIGDLQSFLNDMRFGDLFEGTAADRRNALLFQIGTVRNQADAGEEGAASKLADLERQLIDLSRSAFGTAGPEFATDRAQAEADAQRIIDAETARAREAQEQAIATLNAATTQNDLTNETNGLLAGTNSRLDRILSRLGDGATGTGTGLSALDRVTLLNTRSASDPL